MLYRSTADSCNAALRLARHPETPFEMTCPVCDTAHEFDVAEAPFDF